MRKIVLSFLPILYGTSALAAHDYVRIHEKVLKRCNVTFDVQLRDLEVTTSDGRCDFAPQAFCYVYSAALPYRVLTTSRIYFERNGNVVSEDVTTESNMTAPLRVTTNRNDGNALLQAELLRKVRELNYQKCN